MMRNCSKLLARIAFILIMLLGTFQVWEVEASEEDEYKILKALLGIIRLMDIDDRNMVLSQKVENRYQAASIVNRVIKALELIETNPELKDKIKIKDQEYHDLNLLKKELGKELSMLGYNVINDDINIQKKMSGEQKIKKDINNTTTVNIRDEAVPLSEDLEIEEYRKVDIPKNEKEEYLKGTFSVIYNTNILEGENYYNYDTSLPVFENTGEYFTQIFNLELGRNLNSSTFFILDFLISYDSLDIPVNYEFEKEHIYYTRRRFNYSIKSLDIEKHNIYHIHAGILEPEYWSPYSIDSFSTPGIKMEFKDKLSLLILKVRYPRLTWQDQYFVVHPGNFESWGMGLRYKSEITDNLVMNNYLIAIEDNISSLPKNERQKEIFPSEILESYTLDVLNFSIETISEADRLLSDVIFLEQFLNEIYFYYFFVYDGGSGDFLGFNELKNLFYSYPTFYNEYGSPVEFPTPIPQPYTPEQFNQEYSNLINDLEWIHFELSNIIMNDYSDDGLLKNPEITGERIQNLNKNMNILVSNLNVFLSRIKEYSVNPSYNYCVHVLLPTLIKLRDYYNGYSPEIVIQINYLITETYRFMDYGLEGIAEYIWTLEFNNSDFIYSQSLAIPVSPATEIFTIDKESEQIFGTDLNFRFSELDNSSIYSEYSLMRREKLGKEYYAEAIHGNVNINLGCLLLNGNVFNIDSDYNNLMIHKKIDPFDQVTVLEKRNYLYYPGTEGGEVNVLLSIPVTNGKHFLFGAGFKTKLYEPESILEENKFGKLGFKLNDELTKFLFIYTHGQSLLEEFEKKSFQGTFEEYNCSLSLKLNQYSRITGDFYSERISLVDTNEIMRKNIRGQIELHLNLGHFKLIALEYILGEQEYAYQTNNLEHIFQSNCCYEINLNKKKTLNLIPEIGIETRKIIDKNILSEKLERKDYGINFIYNISNWVSLKCSYFETELHVFQPLIDIETGEVQHDIFNELISGYSSTLRTISVFMSYVPPFIDKLTIKNESIKRNYTFTDLSSPGFTNEERYNNKFILNYMFLKKDVFEGTFEYTNLLWKSNNKEGKTVYSPEKQADIVCFKMKFNVKKESDICVDYILNRITEDLYERNYSKLIIVGNWRF